MINQQLCFRLLWQVTRRCRSNSVASQKSGTIKRLRLLSRQGKNEYGSCDLSSPALTPTPTYIVHVASVNTGNKPNERRDEIIELKFEFDYFHPVVYM